jgi:hypothetical protein
MSLHVGAVFGMYKTGKLNVLVNPQYMLEPAVCSKEAFHIPFQRIGSALGERMRSP